MLKVTETNEILVHNDGASFPFAMIVVHDGVEKTVFADTRTDLFAFFMPGYDALAHWEAEQWLQNFAIQTATQLQLNAVLTSGTDPQKFTWGQQLAVHGTREEPLPITRWSMDQPFPLFLVSTAYAPYTFDPLPTGDNIFVLDPRNETVLLESLEQAGMIRLFIDQEALDAYSDDPDIFISDDPNSPWADPMLAGVWDEDDVTAYQEHMKKQQEN